MAQLFPDGMRNVTMSQVNTAGGINTPPEQDFDTPAMQGSMQQMLSENLGEYVVVEFLIGTQTTMEKRGILYAVGTSFLVLFEEETQTFVVCDIFSVKFVTFFLPGQRPNQMPMRYTPGTFPPGVAPPESYGMGCSGPSCGGYRSLNGR